jgi:hypothetical protein
MTVTIRVLGLVVKTETPPRLQLIQRLTLQLVVVVEEVAEGVMALLADQVVADPAVVHPAVVHPAAELVQRRRNLTQQLKIVSTLLEIQAELEAEVVVVVVVQVRQEVGQLVARGVPIGA